METNNRTSYMQEKIGFSEILQFIANIAILFIAYELWTIKEALEQAAEVVKMVK